MTAISSVNWNRLVVPRVGVVSAMVLLFLTVSTHERPSYAQAPKAKNAAARRFDELDARYWKILSVRPRKGTALDRWYRQWATAGRGEELIERVRAETTANPQDAAMQLLWGLLLERHGQFKEAHTALRRAAEMATDDYFPHFALGSLATRRGNLGEAITELRKAGTLNPPKAQWLEIYKQLGRVQFRSGLRNEALATWEEVARRFPNDVQVLQELAELLTAEGEVDRAIARWEQLTKHSGNDRDRATDAQRKIAQLEAGTGRRDAAIERLDQLLNQLEPGGWLTSDVRRQIEELFTEDGNLAGLVDFYRRRLKTRDDVVDTMLSLATALIQTGKNDQALTLLADAVHRAPSRTVVHERYINQLALLGRFQEAIDHARQFVDSRPTDVEAIQRLANLDVQAAISLNRTALLTDAGNAYRKMAAVRANDPTLALSAAGACEAGAKRAALFAPRSTTTTSQRQDAVTLSQEAETLYREAVRRAPNRPAFHEYLGAYLHRQRDAAGAVEAWKKIASGTHDTAERCLQLAEILNRYAYRDEVVEALRRSIAHDPTRTEPRTQLVRLFLDTHSYDAALLEVEQLRSLAKTSDEIERVLRLRVDALRLSQRIEQAIAELETRIDAESSTPEEHWLFALLLVENGQPAAALSEIEIALSRRPQDTHLLNTAATIAAKAGQWSHAIECFDQLAQLEPQRATVHLVRVARLYLMHGKTDQARAVAKRIVAEHPSYQIGYRLLADILASSGLAEERLTALRRAVEVAPRDLAVRQQLAELLQRRGRAKEALDQYWRSFELVDSHVERLHLISILVPLAQRTKEYPRLLERLRAMERQQRASPEVSLLVVEARRQAGDLRGALEELKVRLAKKGDHREALDTAVLLAQSLGDHRQAVAFQQRVVRIAVDRPALEKLAACRTAAGDHEGAVRAWRQIVHDFDNPQAIIDVVDAEVRRGEIVASKDLLAIGLEEQPNAWRLLLRAAHVALIEGDEATVRQRFQKLWSLPENTHTEANVDHPVSFTTDNGDAPALEIPVEIAKEVPQIEEFRIAAGALEEIAQLHRIVQLASRQAAALEHRHGTPREVKAYERLLRQQRASLQRQVAERFTMPKKLGVAKVVALCGLSEIARQHDKIESWFDESRTAAEPRAIARLAMVAIADGRFELGQQILRDLAKGNPSSPVPHLLRLLADQDSTQLTRLSDAQRDGQLASARTSFAWLQEKRPSWAKQLRPLYWNALLGLQAVQRVHVELRDALDNASGLDELPGLSILATRVGDLALQQQVFEQAVRLPLDADERNPGAEAMRRMLEQNFLYSDDEQYVDSMIAVMDRYLRATQPARVASESGVAPRTIGRTTNLAKHFPEPTPYLDEKRLKVLSRVYKHCALSSRVFALQDFLNNRAAECHGIDRHCYLLESAYLQWWSGELGTAIDTLQMLCNDAPMKASLRVILAQAYKADGSPTLALDQLDRLQDHSVVMGSNVSVGN